MMRSALTRLRTAARLWTAAVLSCFLTCITWVCPSKRRRAAAVQDVFARMPAALKIWRRWSVPCAIIRVALAALSILSYTAGVSVVGAELPAVTAPPDSFFEIVAERDREVARKFY